MAMSAAPVTAAAEAPKRCNLCLWLRPISEYRRQGTDANGEVKRRGVCLPCERAKKHGEALTPDPNYVPPPPPEPKPKPKATPKPRPSRATKADHGWVVGYGCLNCRAGLVKIAVTEKPIMRTPATTYSSIECPDCGEFQRVEVQPRPLREGEECDAELPFLETTT
jgi:hypothetical protein